MLKRSCDLLKNSYLCLLNNTSRSARRYGSLVVICWKIRIFAYWTTPFNCTPQCVYRCDLLKNSYLCLLNNTSNHESDGQRKVVICWKIRIFAYWTTPWPTRWPTSRRLWFAEKFVSLLIEQHRPCRWRWWCSVVICWKIRIFAYWTTPRNVPQVWKILLWFAEKFVSLLIEQHLVPRSELTRSVVICWKIRIFAYWTTPNIKGNQTIVALWFAEKFVSLLIEQHLHVAVSRERFSCDLLKNSYLCLLNNTTR